MKSETIEEINNHPHYTDDYKFFLLRRMAANPSPPLKNCPFCGGAADYNFDGDENFHLIRCGDCRVSSWIENLDGEGFNEIAAIWNARATA